MTLKERSAIVTGAGHGIGRAIAQRFARDGARVLVCDVDGERARAVAASIVAEDGVARPFTMDVTRRDEIEAAVAETVSEWDRLDILVNNAGIMSRMPFLEMTDALWDEVLGINLRGAFMASQTAARQMVKAGRGGRIVNVASNSGIFGGRGRAAYGASKAGLINLTQSMAIELAEHGINVNAVAPGPTLTRPEVQGELMDSAARRMPLARYGKPEEIASVAAFLASEEASFVTGHVYAADGGFTIAGIMEG